MIIRFLVFVDCTKSGNVCCDEEKRTFGNKLYFKDFDTLVANKNEVDNKLYREEYPSGYRLVFFNKIIFFR